MSRGAIEIDYDWDESRKVLIKTITEDEVSCFEPGEVPEVEEVIIEQTKTPVSCLGDYNKLTAEAKQVIPDAYVAQLKTEAKDKAKAELDENLSSKPRIHKLKTDPLFFRLIEDEQKTGEVRFNDRDYRVGDVLILQEYNPEFDKYTGNFAIAEVTHVLENFPGLAEGWVMLSFFLYKPCIH
ncbi:MAG: DUF3850 domain-containing protein [Moorea sp. SIO4A3]|nr:DUF3850 domain-containing protein [Moorena sp. SIO4A3]